MPCLHKLGGGCALRAQAVELQLVVEFFKAGLLLDLFLQGLHRAGDVQPLNAAALRADEVVVVAAWEQQGVVGAAVMQSQTADEAQLLKLDEHAVHGRLVGTAGQIGGFGDVCQSQRLVRVHQDGEDILQSLGAPKARLPGTCKHRCGQLAGGVLIMVLAGGGMMVMEHRVSVGQILGGRHRLLFLLKQPFMQVCTRIDEAGDAVPCAFQLGVFHAFATGLLHRLHDGT